MKKSIIFILLVSLFMQCQKEEAKSTQGKLDVFVGGTVAKNGHASPAYWKNNQEFILPSGTEDSVSYSGVKSIGNYTNAVRVVDGSVYVGGAEVVNGFSVAKIWKDGAATSLSDGTSNSSVNDFLISGTDINAVGDDFIDGKVKAKYWKDGVGTTLSESGEAMGIFLNGADVYIGGYEFISNFIVNGVYWKNGQRVALPNAEMIFGGAASGSDIYFVGSQKTNSGNRLATYWKNGTPNNLSDGLNDARANGIVVNGSNVYVCGYERNESNHYVACYWKNGQKIALGDDSINSFALSIAVSKNGDVYVSGQQEGNSSVLWKNGVSIHSSLQSTFSKVTLVD